MLVIYHLIIGFSGYELLSVRCPSHKEVIIYDVNASFLFNDQALKFSFYSSDKLILEYSNIFLLVYLGRLVLGDKAPSSGSQAMSKCLSAVLLPKKL